MILHLPRSSLVTRNFSAFHASCTVCNFNFSQIIQITNSYSLLPLPHFNKIGPLWGGNLRSIERYLKEFITIYLCQKFRSLQFCFDPFRVRSAFHFFFTFVPLRVIAPVRSYIPFRYSRSQNFLFLALTFFF